MGGEINVVCISISIELLVNVCVYVCVHDYTYTHAYSVNKHTSLTEKLICVDSSQNKSSIHVSCQKYCQH